MKKYDHKKIEKKWQREWEKLRKSPSSSPFLKGGETKPKYYVLDMFPYPSGDGLHMGHTESYTASDIIYRYKKLQGFDVLHPQGFDSFGLPAENYAIKTGIHPKKTTKKNTENYIKQMKMLGLGHDLNHLVYTSNPSYYKWTQWLFGKFFENGFVEQKTDKINWCSSCNTGIANEQVEDGKCERCKTEIEQKEVPGWFFKTTDFAEDLINDLDKVDWPEATKKNQRNWIGRSNGALLNFEVRISNFDSNSNDEILNDEISVFTTRPDTLFGVTYLVAAPEHSLIQNSKFKIQNWNEVTDYVERAKNKTEMERLESKEKTGVKLEGLVAINPANNEEIPIFVADYVLGGYGTGAIMAVPAHDERDFEFATHYNESLTNTTATQSQKDADLTQTNAEETQIDAEKIEIKQVVAQKFVGEGDNAIREDKPMTERKIVDVIIKHWKEDKFFCLDWSKKSKNNWHSFVVGGVEEGETLEEAALREAREETGYKNMRVVKQIGGEIHSYFYAAHKGVNRAPVKRNCIYLELIDGEWEEPAEEHTKNHDGAWIKKDKVAQVINLPELKTYWDIFTGKQEVLFTGQGEMINSGQFDGIDSEEAKKAITEFVGGEMTTNYRLRDWSISRQRYWGCPIPIVYSPEGEAKFVGEENLPWLLPEDVDFVPTGTAPLAKSKELKERTEKLFGKGWTPEIDTMDTFVDSSWYFLRYPDTENEKEFCSPEKLKRWLPVDLYIGGAEHTYMHLLYARFFVKAMHKMGLVNFNEPFLKLRHQGMVLDENGVKMSKSKGNVVNPNDMVEKFGADATRMYMMFATPLDEEIAFKEEGVKGVYRFLEKTWKLFQNRMFIDCGGGCEEVPKELPVLLHKTIKGVTEDIEGMKFNTAISKLMIFINEFSKHKNIPRGAMEKFLILLLPFAPFITTELWKQMGNKGDILNQEWPKYNSEMIQEEEIELVVQVNGKVRDKIKVVADISEDEAKEKALASEKIQKYTNGKEIKKVIFVKGRLVNVVV
ncbi:MAG TPA: NUDIX domain-containing protein [Candidatus Moranbacteria bacterium]|nr:NUDIX domain-containing protein [Candidatus Moranbacteria bacterium]